MSSPNNPTSSGPPPDELISLLSINRTPEELAAIIERLHVSSLAKDQQIPAMQAEHETTTEEHEEQLQAEKDAYKWAYQDYWEERYKKWAAHEKTKKVQEKLDKLKEKYQTQTEELGRYKAYATHHFQRAQDAELELVMRDDELKEARKEINALKAQVRVHNGNFGSAQGQQNVQVEKGNVEMEG